MLNVLRKTKIGAIHQENVDNENVPSQSTLNIGYKIIKINKSIKGNWTTKVLKEAMDEVDNDFTSQAKLGIYPLHLYQITSLVK